MNVSGASVDSGMVIAAGTALAGAIGVLWRRLILLSDQQMRTGEKLGRVEGKQDGIELMSARVLQEIHTIKQAPGLPASSPPPTTPPPPTTE
tara:strand:+ start:762 stop:1037 length:276 start_codon:yes stop_codon:yes gene_type:complete